MNTIQIKVFLTIFFLAVLPAFSARDTLIIEHQEKFYYELQLVNSYSIYLDKKLKIRDKEFSPSIRFLWKPNHKLNLGFQSGVVPILNEENKQDNEKFVGKMNGIPILFNLTYDLYFTYIFAGFGPSLITSKISAMKEEIVTNVWAGTYNYGFGLKIPFARNFSIGVEAQGFYFSKVDKLVAQAGINITYGFWGF